MRIKILFLVIILTFLCFCESISRSKKVDDDFHDKYSESISIEGIDFHEIWDGCIKTLNDRGYPIQFSNMDTGYIHATGYVTVKRRGYKKTPVSQYRYILRIFISDSDKEGIVDLNFYIELKEDEGIKEKEIRVVINAIKEYFKKRI